uniref:Ig-like domain-containing protein n=1 Tax=Meloidogyne incognita TaxID=6306 RepID=A0A914M8Z4_MELIC
MISWHHDGILLFNGTEFEPTSGIEPSRIILQRSLEEINNDEEIKGEKCFVEAYSLLLRNLSLEDSGKYGCQLWTQNGGQQQLDFKLDVLGDSALKLNFPANLTYDHTECCIEKGVSPLCRPMCRPRNIGEEFFDPTSCQVDDYKKFLNCVTNGGKRDYLPCCRKKALPPFCFDFCGNNFQKLEKSHRLCLYYLPEIFDCFSQQYALFPPPAPKNLQMKEVDSGNRRFCFTIENLKNTVKIPSFVVHLQEMNVGTDTMNSRDAAVEEFRKLRKRSENKSGQIYGVTLIKELRGGGKKPVLITKIIASSNERGINSEICIPLESITNKSKSTYLVYVEAINDYGTSEPSKSFLITEEGVMHPAK